MRYEHYRYLYPPRPEAAAAPTTLGAYEALGWWGQAKMNGTNATLYVPPDRKSFAMGRHGEANRIGWQPGERWGPFEQRLAGDGWYVIVGELLHSRGVGVRDTLYLFDLLVDDGEYLIGTTYRQRWHRLAVLCLGHEPERWVEYTDAVKAPEHTHAIVTPGVWLATYHEAAFSEWFGAIRNLPGKPPVEGLVFKDPNARLLPCGSATANAKWQHKCRVPTDHLSF